MLSHTCSSPTRTCVLASSLCEPGHCMSLVIPIKGVRKRCAHRSAMVCVYYTKSKSLPNDTAESFETCLRTHLVLLKAPNPMRCFVAKVGWPIAIPCAPCQEGATHPTPAKTFNISTSIKIYDSIRVPDPCISLDPNFNIFPPPIRPRYHGRTIVGGNEVCLSWGSKTGADNFSLKYIIAAWASGRKDMDISQHGS